MTSYIDTWPVREQLKIYAQRKFNDKGHTLIDIENPHFIFKCGNCNAIVKRKTLQHMTVCCRRCVQKTPAVQKKRKQTMMKKYGVEHGFDM